MASPASPTVLGIRRDANGSHESALATTAKQPALPCSALPNALSAFSDLAAQPIGKRFVFFLDYDGTLSPIVSNPDEAYITEECRAALRQLSARYSASIVSGRSCEKLTAFIGAEASADWNIAGSHGLDIRSRDGQNMLHPVAVEARSCLLAARAQLDEALGEVEGYMTEDNFLCISAHYRNVAAAEHERVHSAVTGLLAQQPSLQHKTGKMVHELRPAVSWDKGKAVEWLLERCCSGEEGGGACPVYIGDDVADEDAFGFVASVGGIGIKVVEPALLHTTRTLARYRLDDPAQVLSFLQQFLVEPASGGASAAGAAAVAANACG